MPTTKPRHMVTETPQITEALEVAARAWPEDKDRASALLVRLILAGKDHVANEREHEIEERRKVIRESAGRFTDLYGPDYLEELRKDWPE